MPFCSGSEVYGTSKGMCFPHSSSDVPQPQTVFHISYSFVIIEGNTTVLIVDFHAEPEADFSRVTVPGA